MEDRGVDSMVVTVGEQLENPRFFPRFFAVRCDISLKNPGDLPLGKFLS
jgi:hypothetical protein